MNVIGAKVRDENCHNENVIVTQPWALRREGGKTKGKEGPYTSREKPKER